MSKKDPKELSIPDFLKLIGVSEEVQDAIHKGILVNKIKQRKEGRAHAKDKKDIYDRFLDDEDKD